MQINIIEAVARRCSVEKVFIEISRNSTATLLKKRLWHSCFPENFKKFLRTSFSQNISGRLLLSVACLKDYVAPYKQQKFLREYQLYHNKDHITFILWGRSIDEIKKLHIFTQIICLKDYFSLKLFLTHFMPLISFDTPWKQEVSKKISGMKWVNQINIRHSAKWGRYSYFLRDC